MNVECIDISSDSSDVGDHSDIFNYKDQVNIEIKKETPERNITQQYSSFDDISQIIYHPHDAIQKTPEPSAFSNIPQECSSSSDPLVNEKDGNIRQECSTFDDISQIIDQPHDASQITPEPSAFSDIPQECSFSPDPLLSEMDVKTWECSSFDDISKITDQTNDAIQLKPESSSTSIRKKKIFSSNVNALGNKTDDCIFKNSISNSPPIYKFTKPTWPIERSPSCSFPLEEVSKSNNEPVQKKLKFVGVNSNLNQEGQQNPGEKMYEVEKIVDHIELAPNRNIYFIKWKGFAEEENSWEPLENLTNCLQLVYAYKSRTRKVPTQINKYDFYRLLSNHTDEFLNIFIQRFRTEQGELNIPKVERSEIDRLIGKFFQKPCLMKSNKCELNYIRQLILTHIAYQKRQTQLENLKRYEIEINVSAGNTTAPIYVINNVDLDHAPLDFTYTNYNIVTDNVKISEEPVLWCECNGDCSSEAINCCFKMNGSVRAYDNNKKLIIPHGTPIYECNKNCKCDDTCSNKVIQKGTKVKLAIFKTYNDCGWGVQALEDIPSGTFVTEYVGEILTNEDASNRINQTYLFNLDFNNSTTYVIDACIFGNISHFINHSCDPNLAVYAAYIKSLDPDFHHLPLFSIKDIKKGQQLTFNYLKSIKNKNSRGKKSKVKYEKCKCKSSNCIGEFEVS